MPLVLVERKGEKNRRKSANEGHFAQVDFFFFNCRLWSLSSSLSTEKAREHCSRVLSLSLPLPVSTHRLSLAVAVKDDDAGPPATGLPEEDAAVGAPGRRGALVVAAAVVACPFVGLPAVAPPCLPTETASLKRALRSAGDSAERARAWLSMAAGGGGGGGKKKRTKEEDKEREGGKREEGRVKRERERRKEDVRPPLSQLTKLFPPLLPLLRHSATSPTPPALHQRDHVLRPPLQAPAPGAPRPREQQQGRRRRCSRRCSSFFLGAPRRRRRLRRVRLARQLGAGVVRGRGRVLQHEAAQGEGRGGGGGLEGSSSAGRGGGREREENNEGGRPTAARSHRKRPSLSSPFRARSNASRGLFLLSILLSMAHR